MRPRLRGKPLALTIGIALVVKLIILTLLHHAFFSAPQARKMRMPTQTVEQHLLGALPHPVPKAQP